MSPFANTPQINSENFQTRLKDYALNHLGFDDCRFTTSDVNSHLDDYRTWLAQGFHGEMPYLEKHLPFKENPSKLLPGARSAVILIKNYKNTPERQLKNSLKIARYAVGKDYHQVMTRKLKDLAAFIQSEDQNIQCYIGVDSRPLPERSLALKAGIGFQGKNTMVIQPGLGSYFFIGAILTTYKFQFDQPLKWDCGQCRLCLDGCPTQAIVEPFVLDATKCISYLTIEKKEPLSDEELKKTEGWIYGCDICQEVCPYNSERVPLTSWKEFLPESGVGFEFFEKNKPAEELISKDTPLYRSRKRVVPNWKSAVKVTNVAKVNKVTDVTS